MGHARFSVRINQIKSNQIRILLRQTGRPVLPFIRQRFLISHPHPISVLVLTSWPGAPGCCTFQATPCLLATHNLFATRYKDVEWCVRIAPGNGAFDLRC